MRFMSSFRNILIAVALFFAAAPAFAQSASSLPPEASWPSVVKQGDVTATIYEPQPHAWPGETSVQATAAVIIQKPGKPPLVGTVDITANTQTDLNTRWVIFSDVTIQDTHFPALNTDQANAVEAKLKAYVATLGPKRIPLDTLLLALQQSNATPPAVQVDNTPPVIFFSTSPAILVVLDGPPVLAPIGKTGLALAVNTNWSLFQDTATHYWYLLDGSSWLSAPTVNGPYQPAGQLPPAFAKLPDNANYAEVLKNLPGTAFPAGQAPTVFVSNKPAEIIVTQGPARLSPIPGAPLQFVSNTGAEVIFDPADRLYYVLLSGRWFSAPSLDGPWVFATPHLPASFALIPPDGPKAELLASVPGTAQAQEAAITAAIPTQASLPRSTTTQVTYVGAPNFAPIPNTTLQYAVNSTSQVILANGRYYVCANGAWFVGNSPTGPFVLASAVPQAIYTIPPSFPYYPVTYVRIYSVTPAVIVMGYTAGYTMGMISPYGVVVYGTGYYYPPVIIGGAIPIYLPYPYSYAGGYVYHSATGVWSSGGAVYGPYGGAAARSVYNPATGAYAHGSAVWGPNGGYAQGSFSNPTTGRSGSTSQSWSPYGRYGSSTVTGPNQTVHTQSRSNVNGSAGGFTSTSGAQGAGVHNAYNGNNTGAVKTANGDVYAGHNGNVYQQTDSGWSKWNSQNNSFQPVQQPTRSNANTASQNNQHSSGSPASGTRASGGSGGGWGGDASQVQRDQQARQGGWQRQNSFGGGGFGGGGFGGSRRR
jgi:hypothetical protein